MTRQVRAVAVANQTLTGAATIDGVVLATGDRVLCANQTLPAANGIYVANTAGAWTLATDWQTGSVLMGMRVYVGSEGAAYPNTEWG